MSKVLQYVFKKMRMRAGTPLNGALFFKPLKYRTLVVFPEAVDKAQTAIKRVYYMFIHISKPIYNSDFLLDIRIDTVT